MPARVATPPRVDAEPIEAESRADPNVGKRAASPDAPSSTPPPASDAEAMPLRSRRALLVAALGGLAGSIAGALGRPAETRAAAGDGMVVGTDNFAGASGTHLFATSSGGAFWATQYGFGSGVRGDSVSGHGGVFSTQHGARFGLNASNTAASGTGAAISASGGNLVAIRASSSGTAIVVNAGGTGIDVTATGVSSAIHASMSNPVGLPIGVTGVATGEYGYGVFGRGNGTGAARGVYGDASSATGFGVEGYNPNNVGVMGSGNPGVNGVSSAEFGSGVSGLGMGTSGHGVVGSISQDSSTASGVYGGSAGTGSYAGYFEGSVGVTGSLSKAGGSFRIDHPLDPANRILQHSFVESPDMKNVYDGVVIADDHGNATVELPSWFEALNRDFRYGLTALDAAMPDLHVRARLEGGRFGVGGAAPRGTVSWQLTGIRKDAWAEANRIEVELDKQGEQRGRYLHPIEHGQARTRGVDYPMQQHLADMRRRSSAADATRPPR
jgi:hypothetical protein